MLNDILGTLGQFRTIVDLLSMYLYNDECITRPGFVYKTSLLRKVTMFLNITGLKKASLLNIHSCNISEIKK